MYQERCEQAPLLPAPQPNGLALAHDLQRPQHTERRRHLVVHRPSNPTTSHDTAALELRSRTDCAARPLRHSVVEENILAHHPNGRNDELRTILHYPGRIAAAAVTAGLLFAAGGAAGSASGSEGAHSDTTQPSRDVPVATAADADTLWHYLGTQSPTDRAQTIIALNPNVSGALEAIVAGMQATANTH